jgi:hypothetical protein
MKIHDKAKLYDELIKDFESLLTELKSHSKMVNEIPNREDLVSLKQSGSSTYYPMLSGTYHGSNFALDMKISKAEDTLNWYKSQK